MKRYLALVIVPLLLSGCGKDLNDVNIDDTNTQTDIETIDVTTVSSTEQNTDTVLDTTYDSLDSDTVESTSDVSIKTDTEENKNTIELSEVTIATTVSGEDTTTTTTHILSSYGDEEQLMSLATSLYDVACEMYWNYYYSSPYPIDYNQSIEDDDGVPFFLVYDDSITSLDDVRQDWFEVFTSTKDPKDFDGHFIEKDGRVYVNDGSRGCDIYYSNTEMTSIISTVGDEVTFSAVSHYIDPYDGSFVEDITSEFSIILENGSYHVGEFTLPY